MSTSSPPVPPDSFTDHDIRLSLAEGGLFGLMVGLGETYLAAFALSVGTGEVVAGLLMTIPMLTGAMLQLTSPWGVSWLASNRRWVVISALCQALSLLLIPMAVLFTKVPMGWLFACASLYWAGGLATGPAWNTWMEHLVPQSIRARFFARRAWLCHACTLVGFATGGVLLQTGQVAGEAQPVFVLIFLGAGLSRLASGALLARQREPHYESTPHALGRLWQTFTRLRTHDHAWLLVYIFLTQIAVQVSAPFFTPYLLSERKFSYLAFMLLIGAAFVGKMLAMPLWGRFAHASGARALLRLGGLLIIPLAALWTVSANWEYLFVLQILSGVAWGAQELGILLMFFEAIPYRDRTSVLTIYNVGNTVSIVTGSTLGASLLYMLQSRSFTPWLPAGWSPFLVLFLSSSLARLVAVPFLVRIPERTAEVELPAVRVVSVRPDASELDPPVLPSLSEPEP